MYSYPRIKRLLSIQNKQPKNDSLQSFQFLKEIYARIQLLNEPVHLVKEN